MSAPCVLQCKRLLPAFPFRGTTAAVAQLRVPAASAPPLSELCRCGLEGFSPLQGSAFATAAGQLHPRHQVPFVLSRVAASRAIEALTQSSDGGIVDAEKRVVFTGTRQSARELHGCEVSVSHESTIAAALAWWPTPPSALSKDPSGGQPPAPPDASRGKDDCLSAAGGLVCAIDVCPVAEVHRVRRRFPQLGQRWLPQCVTAAPAATVAAALQAVAEQPDSDQEPREVPPSSSLPRPVSHSQRRRGRWWTHLRDSRGSEAEAYAALVLAQHWGCRECAVKLLGIPGRAFPYASLGSCGPPSSQVPASAPLPFTVSFMQPHTVYCGAVREPERGVWQGVGRGSTLHLYSWFEWYRHTDEVDMPCAVVAACCTRV